MLWKLPGWNPYTPCLWHFFILHSSYSSEQENHLVLLDFLVPNGYLFFFWVFSKFQNKFLNFPGVSYFLFFVNHQALGELSIHKCLQDGWLEWDSYRHKCSQATAWARRPDTHQTAKDLVFHSCGPQFPLVYILFCPTRWEIMILD